MAGGWDVVKKTVESALLNLYAAYRKLISPTITLWLFLP